MRRYLIILLTLITAGMHFYYFTTGSGLLWTLFLLNGLGYLGLLGLLYLPLGLPAGLHKLVRPVFIGYTILTIVLYIVISANSYISTRDVGYWSLPWGPIEKIDEIILAWQLWLMGQGPKSIAA